ncbi:hypothetical protein DMUE_1750 [Dictyocoela muelleri]|nr:hypothetical protein DMUE_1750 [Dictyocoela muelleri]
MSDPNQNNFPQFLNIKKDEEKDKEKGNSILKTETFSFNLNDNGGSNLNTSLNNSLNNNLNNSLNNNLNNSLNSNLNNSLNTSLNNNLIENINNNQNILFQNPNNLNPATSSEYKNIPSINFGKSFSETQNQPAGTDNLFLKGLLSDKSLQNKIDTEKTTKSINNPFVNLPDNKVNDNKLSDTFKLFDNKLSDTFKLNDNKLSDNKHNDNKLNDNKLSDNKHNDNKLNYNHDINKNNQELPKTLNSCTVESFKYRNTSEASTFKLPGNIFDKENIKSNTEEENIFNINSKRGSFNFDLEDDSFNLNLNNTLKSNLNNKQLINKENNNDLKINLNNQSQNSSLNINFNKEPLKDNFNLSEKQEKSDQQVSQILKNENEDSVFKSMKDKKKDCLNQNMTQNINQNINHNNSNCNNENPQILDNSDDTDPLIPIDIQNKPIKEILDDLYYKLENDISTFMKKAESIYNYDLKIIRARNNYCEVLDSIEKFESEIDSLENNLEVMINWVDNQINKNKLKNQNIDDNDSEKLEMFELISEVEKLNHEYNSLVNKINDDDNEVVALMNENLRLIKIIDEEMNNWEN